MWVSISGKGYFRDDGLPDDDKQPKKKPASAKKMPPKVKIGLFSDPL